MPPEFRGRRAAGILPTDRLSAFCHTAEAIGAAAWFLISNHRALAAFESITQTSMPSCHAGIRAPRAPARNQSETEVQCCRGLSATLLTPAGSAVLGNDFSVGSSNYVVALF